MVAVGYFFPEVLVFISDGIILSIPPSSAVTKKALRKVAFNYIFINKYIILYKHMYSYVHILFSI